jgi:hypothetical protein
MGAGVQPAVRSVPRSSDGAYGVGATGGAATPTPVGAPRPGASWLRASGAGIGGRPVIVAGLMTPAGRVCGAVVGEAAGAAVVDTEATRPAVGADAATTGACIAGACIAGAWTTAAGTATGATAWGEGRGAAAGVVLGAEAKTGGESSTHQLPSVASSESRTSEDSSARESAAPDPAEGTPGPIRSAQFSSVGACDESGESGFTG